MCFTAIKELFVPKESQAEEAARLAPAQDAARLQAEAAKLANDRATAESAALAAAADQAREAAANSARMSQESITNSARVLRDTQANAAVANEELDMEDIKRRASARKRGITSLRIDRASSMGGGSSIGSGLTVGS